jgi:uncharacterized protein YprB with RNaseH-like and TPR domain
MLKERLQALRDVSRSPPDAGDLPRRIHRLRGSGAAADGDRPMDEAELALALGAREHAAGLWLLDTHYPAHMRHGKVRLTPPDALAAGFPDYPGVAQGDWLFLDTETTGLGGGSGTLAFLVGVARFEANRLRLQQLLITRFGAERALLAALVERVQGGETLVSYNGKSFDLPLLAVRFRMHGIGDPLVRLRHLDLLHPMRRRYGRQWENCRLATLERRLLGFVREGDLPGAAAPRAWIDFVREGRGHGLQAVMRHNRLDLLSLAAVFPALLRPVEQGGESEPPAQAPGR